MEFKITVLNLKFCSISKFNLEEHKIYYTDSTDEVASIWICEYAYSLKSLEIAFLILGILFSKVFRRVVSQNIE